jgi:diguanylate cyclase (GGDEF)-like protein/PAS domain S-box-containing protein
VAAAQQRPARAGRPSYSRDEVLREAVALGVDPDDQAALLALARVASDRPGFRTTIGVTAADGSDHLFEVAATPQGPVARPVGTRTPAPDAGAAPSSSVGEPPPREGTGLQIVDVLTDTVVHTPDLVAVFASVGHEAIWANDAFATLIPVRASDKVWLVELLDEWSKGHYEVKVLPALVKYGRWRGRLTLIAGEDESLPVSAVIIAHRDRQGEIEAVSLVARDLTELRLAEERANATETRFAALVEHASDIIAVLDPDGTVRYASPAAARVLGRGEDELVGSDLLGLVHPEDRPADLVSLSRPDEHGIGETIELRVRSADGGWRHLEVVVSDLTDNPAIGGLVLNARDVTDRVEAVQALATKAFTDALTGLPNRMRLLDRLAQALHASERDGDGVGLLLLDLDGLRTVNQAHGQATGDELLRTLAGRLVAAAGEATVARMRSDEFAVLVPGAREVGPLVQLADRLRSAVAEPYVAGDLRVQLTASVGVALATSDEEPEDVLRNADVALVHAQDAGGDRCEVFSPELAAEVERRADIEQRLRRAMDHDSLVVHYQPIVDVASERIVGAEALLRVQDGDEVLSPAAYLEAAESNGLITRIGSQVLRATCAQMASWRSRADRTSPLEISVNVSPRQLADPGLPTLVRQALESAGIAPGHLALEITESLLVGHQATVDAGLSYLRSLGVRLGLDEFGTGQSSLGYLKRFPLDFVKIDRALIAGLGRDEQDTAIVRATIELAHDLGLTVVAVGVETREQLEMLRLLGCDRAQGYLFAPALTPEELASRVGAPA